MCTGVSSGLQKVTTLINYISVDDSALKDLFHGRDTYHIAQWLYNRI